MLIFLRSRRVLKTLLFSFLKHYRSKQYSARIQKCCTWAAWHLEGRYNVFSLKAGRIRTQRERQFILEWLKIGMYDLFCHRLLQRMWPNWTSKMCPKRVFGHPCCSDKCEVSWCPFLILRQWHHREVHLYNFLSRKNFFFYTSMWMNILTWILTLLHFYIIEIICKFEWY